MRGISWNCGSVDLPSDILDSQPWNYVRVQLLTLVLVAATKFDRCYDRYSGPCE
jgi:hypothetical protein